MQLAAATNSNVESVNLSEYLEVVSYGIDTYNTGYYIACALAATYSGRPYILALSFHVIDPSTINFWYKWNNFGIFLAIMGYYGTVEFHLIYVT